MKKVCKGCFEIVDDYNGTDYCNLCEIEIESGEDGWLELKQNGGKK